MERAGPDGRTERHLSLQPPRNGQTDILLPESPGMDTQTDIPSAPRGMDRETDIPSAPRGMDRQTNIPTASSGTDRQTSPLHPPGQMDRWTSLSFSGTALLKASINKQRRTRGSVVSHAGVECPGTSGSLGATAHPELGGSARIPEFSCSSLGGLRGVTRLGFRGFMSPLPQNSERFRQALP